MELEIRRKEFTEVSTISELYINGIFSSGIYSITSPSNKVYIGQAVNINKRFSRYNYLVASKGQRKLYNSFCKYGIKNHKFEVVTYCSVEELDILEKEYISKLNSTIVGLNCRSGGRDGSSVSEEGKREISKKLKEYWKNNKELRTGINNPNKGKPLSEEHKLKQSITKKKSGRYKGGNNPNAKIVICLTTGIFYDSLKEACEALSLKYSATRAKLQGLVKNTTSLIYI